MQTLGRIASALTVIAVLVGFIIALVAYLRKGKARAALLGAIGFLILFLFNCCSFAWGLVDSPILRAISPGSSRPYFTVKTVVLFLAALVNLVGLGLIIAAVASAGRKG
jgi:hypothetical protein